MRLKRLVSLTGTERKLLLRTLFVVCVARLALWLLPTRSVRRIAAKASAPVTPTSVEQFVWAVKVVSRYVPKATCLTQAVALHALLSRAGHESRIEIGVAKDADHHFEAHAWVFCGNHVVIGGPDVSRYVRLMAWDTRNT